MLCMEMNKKPVVSAVDVNVNSNLIWFVKKRVVVSKYPKD